MSDSSESPCAAGGCAREALATGTGRRQLISGMAAAGLAVPVLAACGSSGTSAPAPGAGSGSGSGQSFQVSASEIPVGGGKIFPSDAIVVTQPAAGQFKAFSAVCTHAGCIVSQISNGEIVCGCHFSMYSISDGSVQGGPAPRPLPELSVSVSGDTLTVSA